MTIHLFNSILTMTTTLKLTNDINSILPKSTIFNTPLFSNKYIVKHNSYNTLFHNSIEYHNIKCWKSNCILYYYINDSNNDEIFKVDFNINKNDINNPFIYIDYLGINNDFYDKKYNSICPNQDIQIILTDDETILIKKSIIKFIENFAIKENINKIIIDVHSNLERYNYELKEEGFTITNNICNLKPFSIRLEKIINKLNC
jgi:hypothetical protein